MTLYAAKVQGMVGFYSSEIHENLPLDRITVTEEERDIAIKAESELSKTIDIVGGQLVLIDDSIPVLSYRMLRSNDFTLELSEEGNFQNTVGDILDALIKHAYGDSTNLDILKTKIDIIKARHPKEL